MELSSPSTPPPRELAVVTRFTPERPGLPHQPSVEGPHGFGLVGVCTQLLGPRGPWLPAPRQLRPVLSAGNTMTVSYMTGLTLGSAVAYCTYSLTRDGHRSCFQTSASNASFSAGL